jgi:hypothetical protein
MIEPNWDKTCLECQSENGGSCPMPRCAEMHYDQNGNPIDASLTTYDGDYRKET